MSRRATPTLMFFMYLLTGGSAQAADAVLGRLFFTPVERAKLDARRLEAIANANRPAPPPVAEAPPKAPQSQVLTLNGVVRRSDGESTVWINGKSVSRQSEFGSRAVGEGAVGVDLPGSGKRVRLKVGQSVESLSGVVEESYRRRLTLPAAQVQVPEPASRSDTRADGETAPAQEAAGSPPAR